MTAAATPSPDDLLELRLRAIEVASWARTLHQPGSEGHAALDVLVERLKADGVLFRPADGDSAAAAALQDFALAARALGALRHKIPPGAIVDRDLVARAEAMALGARADLLRVVTFEEVYFALRDARPKGDLAAAVKDLNRRLSAYRNAALEG